MEAEARDFTKGEVRRQVCRHRRFGFGIEFNVWVSVRKLVGKRYSHERRWRYASKPTGAGSRTRTRTTAE